VTIGAFTVVEDGAVIGDNSVLYAHVYVGFDVRIGRDCLIYPRATLRERVALGDRVVLQPGAVIGCDGFGFTVHEGRHYKIPQVGTVEIGDDVEIQANTTIDRAAVGVTKIGRGTKIDNTVNWELPDGTTGNYRLDGINSGRNQRDHLFLPPIVAGLKITTSTGKGVWIISTDPDKKFSPIDQPNPPFTTFNNSNGYTYSVCDSPCQF
jgi:carbonic anhydrase/acetyltransferase-like protein (isoleucine patch superfamily)